MKINNQNWNTALTNVCFKSEAAALKASRKVNANPSAEYVEDFGYLARGEDWINNNGSRGRHYYGKGGELIEFDLTAEEQYQILGWL